MKDTLFIPKKLKIGFQKREGTYTGMLAYVIYYDNGGKLRKEASWNSWCHKDIPSIEVDNDPISGFVINKKVGGVKESYSWNARQEYVRIYDSRNWEFEINVPNLLFILAECNCQKGKGIEGEFVYAYSGTQLVLLPVHCAEYQNSTGFTELQGKTVHKKELIEGRTYKTNRNKEVTYIGKLKCYQRIGWSDSSESTKLVFVDAAGEFHFEDNHKKLAAIVSTETHPSFGDMSVAYANSMYGSKAVAYHLMDFDPNTIENQWWINHWYENSPGQFTEIQFRRDGSCSPTIYSPISIDSSSLNGRGSTRSISTDVIEPSNKMLVAELESGAVFKMSCVYRRSLDGPDIREEFRRQQDAKANRGSSQASS